MSQSPPLRLGVLCDGTTVPRWQAECLCKLLALPAVEVVLIIVDAPDACTRSRVTPPARIAAPLRSRPLLWRLYTSRYLTKRMRSVKPLQLAETLVNIPTMRRSLTRSGAVDDRDASALNDDDLDAILCLLPDTLSLSALPAPRHGVWVFHHGTSGPRSDCPPCFWEIYHDDAIVVATLERVSGSNGVVVLREGHFKSVGYSYARTCDGVLGGCVDWPAQICLDIQTRGATGGALPSWRNTPTATRYGTPRGWHVARLLLALGRRFLHAAFHRALYSEEWNVGVADAPIEAFLVPGARPPIRWLPVQKGGFVADPFWLGEAHGEDGPGIAVERFDHHLGRGHIAVQEAPHVSDASAHGAPVHWRPVIDAATHLSYPYVIRHQGQTYCVPENSMAREVALYRITEYPSRWERRATLIADFAALDATVLYHEERWWLFCSEARHIQNNTLFAWHAPDILGPWTPHAGNPLKVDIRSSRPGGTPFVHNGELYRPAQDCSRTYGGAVTINRVRRLTPTEFSEEAVVTVLPYVDGPYPDGLHTLSTYGRRTLIDGKRVRFAPVEAWLGLRAASGLLRAFVQSRAVRRNRGLGTQSRHGS